MSSNNKVAPAIIVHGGAFDFHSVLQNVIAERKAGIQAAVRAGYEALVNTDNPVDAVETAIKVMELDPVFNAGKGAYLARNGEVEMDAIIIRGSDLKAGAVGAIKHVLHPISVARSVMEETSHVLLVAEGAEKFAKKQGFPIVDSEQLKSAYALQLLEKARRNQDSCNFLVKEAGTVGAVAVNSLGELVAGTSTGGVSGKLPGRVGDSPIIGGGTFCNDQVGISSTGMGEVFMRTCFCSKIAEYMKQGQLPNQACLSALEYMALKIPEARIAGAILISGSGEIGYNFTSEAMIWSYVKQGAGVLHYGMEKGDDFTTKL